jgi:hypothetical protein
MTPEETGGVDDLLGTIVVAWLGVGNAASW